MSYGKRVVGRLVGVSYFLVALLGATGCATYKATVQTHYLVAFEFSPDEKVEKRVDRAVFSQTLSTLMQSACKGKSCESKEGTVEIGPFGSCSGSDCPDYVNVLNTKKSRANWVTVCPMIGGKGADCANSVAIAVGPITSEKEVGEVGGAVAACFKSGGVCSSAGWVFRRMSIVQIHATYGARGACPGPDCVEN